MKEIADSQDATVIAIAVMKTAQYHFVAKLKKNLIRARLVDIEGEARLLVTVQGKLNEGDSPVGVEQLVPKVDAMRAFQGNQQPSQNREACGRETHRPAKASRFATQRLPLLQLVSTNRGARVSRALIYPGCSALAKIAL